MINYLSSDLVVQGEYILHRCLKMSASVVALRNEGVHINNFSKCGIFSVETVTAFAYICQETAILLRVVTGFISVIDVEECLLHRAEQVDPGFQLDLRLVSLSFSGDESDELAFRRNIVGVRATEHVPAMEQQNSDYL